MQKLIKVGFVSNCTTSELLNFPLQFPCVNYEVDEVVQILLLTPRFFFFFLPKGLSFPKSGHHHATIERAVYRQWPFYRRHISIFISRVHRRKSFWRGKKGTECKVHKVSGISLLQSTKEIRKLYRGKNKTVSIMNPGLKNSVSNVNISGVKLKSGL